VIPRLFLAAITPRESHGFLSVILAAMLLLAAPPALLAQKAKLPKPRVLERGTRFERNSATGEMGLHSAETSANLEALPAGPAIRTSVSLVEVGCTVLAPDGTQVRGLERGDFRLFEDGVEQSIASFDAAAMPASIALVIDASPSIYRELGQMREAARSLSSALGTQDEVAVLAFSDQTHLLLPFSRDRALLAAALASPELARVADSSQSFIYQALYLTARQLFADRTGRKAIVLLTDGQDSGLGLTWDPATMRARPDAANMLAFDDVTRELAASGIELHVISTENRPRAMSDAWLAAHRGQTLVTPAARELGMPDYTLYLAELVRQAGGRLYFLRELASLAEAYHRIALTLAAEYTLGYYPAAGIARSGWRALGVELRPGAGIPAGAQITHRTAYYVPVSP
jgi:Ca-activated chloride channel homolog